jgi:hypothetical protein
MYPKPLVVTIALLAGSSLSALAREGTPGRERLVIAIAAQLTKKKCWRSMPSQVKQELWTIENARSYA